MEWIDGVKLTDKAKMDAAGLDIVDFVDIGIECTLRQLLEHGYFHADPHPGKSFVPESCRVFFVPESCRNSFVGIHSGMTLGYWHCICISCAAFTRKQAISSRSWGQIYCTAYSDIWFHAWVRVCLNHVRRILC